MTDQPPPETVISSAYRCAMELMNNMFHIRKELPNVTLPQAYQESPPFLLTTRAARVMISATTRRDGQRSLSEGGNCFSA